jgi:hypothetical protein
MLLNARDTRYVERVVGSPIIYQDGTASFGEVLREQWAAVMHQKDVKAHLQTIAVHGRHWYFHHIDSVPDFERVYHAMDAIVHVLAAAESGEGRSGQHDLVWARPTVIRESVALSLRLEQPSNRMTLPSARVQLVVGREAIINDVTMALCPDEHSATARVLLYGSPGVGKDTVMAEVAHATKVNAIDGLKAWLCASSDKEFRRQLLELFQTHHPNVVAAHADDDKQSLVAIRAWLHTHTDWVFFVEDATLACTTLWQVIPEVGGRLLVTSQAQLHKDHGVLHPFELGPITTDESIELLRRMDPFSRSAETLTLDEEELQFRCESASLRPLLYALTRV